MTSLEIGAVKFRNALNRLFPHGKGAWCGCAIITAAGSGTRMGGVSKPLYPLAGKKCLSYSLHAFDACNQIVKIIVTAREEELSEIESVCLEEHLKTPFLVVAGGATRQESVAKGFLHLPYEADFVAIHDGARPLIQTYQIEKVIGQARRYGAACAAEKVTDTVKRAKENDLVLETVPREDLYAVQTPQVFRSDVYRVSLALAQRDQFSGTDDCSLVENAGFPIKLVEIGEKNWKLTTPEDVSVISHHLEDRRND